MASGGSLSFRLFGVDVSASRALRNLGNAAKNAANGVDDAASHMSGAFGLFGNAAKAAIGSVIGAASALTAAIGHAGINMSNQLEQATISFTTLLGSAKAAHAMIDDLSKFAATTPFEFAGLVDMSRMLLGVGVAAKDVIPTLTIWGDTVGALGLDQEHFQRILFAVSQSMASGRFQLQDLNQLADNGLPIWKMLAESLHKSVPELRDMSSKGQLLTSTVLPKLYAEMQKDYGGNMAKQSQTLAGLWSNLTDMFSQGSARAIQPLVPMIKRVMNDILQAMTRFFDYLSGTAIPTMQSFGSEMTRHFDDIARTGQAAGTALLGVAAGLAAMKASIAVVGSLQSLAAIGSALAAASAPVLAVIAAIGAVVGAVVVLWLKMKAFRDTVKDVASNTFGKLKKLGQENAVIFRFFAGMVHVAADAFRILFLPILGGAWKAGLGIIVDGFRVLGWLFRNVTIPAILAVAKAFLWAVQKIADTMGWIADKLPWGLGSGLKSASNSITQFVNKANADLAQIENPTITVTIRQVGPYNGYGVKSPNASPFDKFFPKVNKKPKVIAPITSFGMGGGSVGGGGGGGGGASEKKSALQAVVKEIGAPLTKALLDTRESLATALQGLIEDVAKTGSKYGVKVVATARKTLLELAGRRDSLVARLTAWKKRLQDLMTASVSFVRQVRDQVIETGNASKANGTFQSVVYNLQVAVYRARQFASVVAQLRKKGLDQVTLNQLIQAGPESLQTAYDILKSGPGGIKQIGDLQRSLIRAGNSIGQTGADSLYQAGIQTARGMVAGLQSQEKQIEAVMVRVARTMVTAIKKALGIKSPSRVFADEVGRMVPLGVAAGIDAHAMTAVNAVSSMASRMSTVGVSTAWEAGRSLAGIPDGVGGRGGDTYHINIDNSFGRDDARVARVVTEAIKAQNARGLRVRTV